MDKASEAMLEAVDAQLQDFVSVASGIQCQSGVQCQIDQPLEVWHITSESLASDCAQQMEVFSSHRSNPVPVFKVDNTTGKGLVLLHTFLSKLHTVDGSLPSHQFDAQDTSETDTTNAVHFLVDELFDVKGTGQVASGTLVRGRIEVGQKLLSGPTAKADFKPVTVKSIERSQVPVLKIKEGQVATLLYKEDEGEFQHVGGNHETSISPKNHVNSPIPEAQLDAATKQISQLAVSLQSDLTSSLNGNEQNGDGMEAGRQDSDSASNLGNGGLERKAGTQSESLEMAQRSDGPENHTDRRHDVWQSNRCASSLDRHSGKSSVDICGDHHVEGNSDSDGYLHPPHQGRTPVEERLNGVHRGTEMETSVEAPTMQSSGRDSTSQTNLRKGIVFVDPQSDPLAKWEFEALMVLFSGFWPPRGLLSGSWPFSLDAEHDFGLGTSNGTSPNLQHISIENASSSLGRSPRSRSLKRGTRGIYTPMIHCNNVRQAAKVVSMHEESLPEDWTAEDVLRNTGMDLSPALSAALSLAITPSEASEPDICVARVKFRFQHEPAWIEAGTKVVARDRTESCLSGAGLVIKTLPN